MSKPYTPEFTGGFQDTRTNKEDFAITPYLFFVKAAVGKVLILGIGVCWGYYAGYIGLIWNKPKGYLNFKRIPYCKTEQNI
jgi:hypothetical protein